MGHPGGEEGWGRAAERTGKRGLWRSGGRIARECTTTRNRCAIEVSGNDLVAATEEGVGRTLEVTPDHWLARGEAVSHRGRNPLVVWGGIPGEAGRVRLLHKGAHQTHAEWVSADTPDPHRVVPPCE
jgi:hypothetical protein